MRNSEFAWDSVQVIERDWHAVFADRLHLEPGGRPVSYEIRDDLEAGEATEVEAVHAPGRPLEANLSVYRKWSPPIGSGAG